MYSPCNCARPVLHHYGMSLLVYGRHQPPVHFRYRFREKNSSIPIRNFSARLEEQDGHLAQVEVNEMLCLVGDVAAEVPPDDAVPGGVVLLVKLLKKKPKRRKWIHSKSKSEAAVYKCCLTYNDQSHNYHIGYRAQSSSIFNTYSSANYFLYKSLIISGIKCQKIVNIF